MIDINKDKMPTQLAKDLLELCAKQDKFNTFYRVCYARFKAVPYHYDGFNSVIEDDVKTEATVHHVFCQIYIGNWNHMDIFTGGKPYIPECWLKEACPFTYDMIDDEKFVVISIEKYNKRARED